MIDKQEIMRFARMFGISANHLEKDYVLGWLLAGISNHPATRLNWVFKGGTCVKKCFIETYRFSEDLDFTLQDETQIDKKFLERILIEVAEWTRKRTGIEFPSDLIGIDIYTNKMNWTMAQGRIGYRGPMRQRRGSLPRIKLDLTAYEALVQEPVIRPVHHPYSDRPEEGIRILSYSYEEVFAEKIRALMERESPRDLYDVVHLYRQESGRPDRVMSVLKEKCAFKGVEVPVTAASLENREERASIERQWGSMLKHQVPALPPFEQLWAELPLALDWLHGVSEKAAQSPLPFAGTGSDLDEDWRPPEMIHIWKIRAPLERVRFAAANRLHVNLTYEGDEQQIEPYSLRRAREGHLLLYAVDRATGRLRSYKVDRLKDIEISGEPFAPRYAISLTPNLPR